MLTFLEMKHVKNMPTIKKHNYLFISILLLMLLACFSPQKAQAQHMKKHKFKKIEKNEKKKQKKADKAFDPKPRWPKRKVKPRKHPKNPYQGTPVQKKEFDNPPEPRKTFKPKRISGKRDPKDLRSSPREESKVIDNPFNQAPTPRKEVNVNRYDRYLKRRRQELPLPIDDDAFDIKVKTYTPGAKAKYDKQFKGPEKTRLHHPYWMNETLREEYGGKKGRFLGSVKRKNPEKQLRKKSRKMAAFEGPVKMPTAHSKEGFYKKKNKNTASFQGRYKMFSQRGRESFYKKKMREMSSFQGRFLTFTEKGRDKFYKKRAEDFADFETSFKRRKRNDDMHPSAAYLNGKRQTSYKQKERSRRWWKWWHRWRRNADQPKHLKEKPKKPKYDTKESEIWYD
jgi:hypothetical protein